MWPLSSICLFGLIQLLKSTDLPGGQLIRMSNILRGGLTKYSAALFAISFIWFIAITYIALASIPFNPLSLSFNQKNSIFILASQGWGFFTRNARESEIVLYKRINNRWVHYNKASADPEYFFGASRMSRRINVELLVLTQQIKDTSVWIDGNQKKLDTSSFHTSPIFTIVNSYGDHILLGEFIVIKSERLPWAWSSNFYSIIMPYKYIHFIAISH